jgi:hypothetical protein
MADRHKLRMWPMQERLAAFTSAGLARPDRLYGRPQLTQECRLLPGTRSRLWSGSIRETEPDHIVTAEKKQNLQSVGLALPILN